MKLLHYSKILLFSLPLNILVSPSYANNKNKSYITPHHTPITTSRVLSECDLYIPNYDKDPDMKYVKKNFDRQTSKRFEEYDERMNEKRQKSKEQRDKNVQKIIEKDKMDKSLAEKVEKGCLRCGCGLGGVAASVGIFGAIAVNEWTKAALVAANQKGIEEGIKVAIEKLGNIVGLSQFNVFDWSSIITATTYYKPMELVPIVSKAYNASYNACTDSKDASNYLFCQATKAMKLEPNVSPIQVISKQAAGVAAEAEKAAKATEATEISLVNAESTHLYSAIGYSVLAILIIVLILVIIYLILRYRRKTKMNKKQQYTKLLNQ
ncbi:surface antigen [Plasmodium falciparum UGT5.1]|uniref:Surface antigen n=1 Tax=Plasmodium falciparum UGT5.1 TaxID=1237627 RepID=W7JYF1_PLAFA|nr:surface antigen [Plasmodium falciparum UGT5.1]